MNTRSVVELLETLLILISITAIAVVLWTYHPVESPAAPPEGCTVQSDGPTDLLAHLPATKIGKANR
jgi:hypothetical protein